jgi:hypothetical protein
MNKLVVLAFMATIIVVGIGAYFLIKPSEEQVSGPLPPAELTENSHFGFVPTFGMGTAFGKEQDGEEDPYEVWFNTFEGTAVELGTPWIRPHPGPFSWHLVEPTQGTYDFSATDACVKAAQEHNLHVLATVWPFAEWDQEWWENQPGWEASQGFEHDLPTSRYKPHDMDAYKRFVRAMVERYDNDGENDMSDLRYPVRHWEVLNEPETGGWGDLNFFKGTVQDYLEVLQATQEAIASADPSAIVLQGGATGQDEFWDDLLSLGGGDYFDIGNIHSINGPDDLNTGWYFELLENYGLQNFWVTEVQIASGESVAGYRTEEEQAELIVKGYVEAFGNGAERAFYVNYRAQPGKPGEPAGEFESSALIDETGRKKPAYYAMRTLMEKLDYFASVTKLTDGQYKFIVNDEPVYVLWGSGSIPSEITGVVKVTDISGSEQQMNALEIILSDSPIFVELA